MTTQRLYYYAVRCGCTYVDSCVGIGQSKWDECMKGATRADKKLATKIALLAGVIDEEYARQELRKPWFNPYKHFKTKTHIIYTQSGIEHFIFIHTP